MASHLSKLLAPPRFLMLTYALGAALGLVQGILVARLLGSAGYGVVGILVTLAGLSSSFWDFRLIDLSTKLHYAKASAAEQTASMRMLLALNTSLALLMSITALGLILLCWHFFTETVPEPLWIFIQAATIGIGFIAGTAQSLQRLTDSFYSFALMRLFAQALSLIIMIAWLVHSPGISGYYDGLFTANLVTLALALGLLAWLWRRRFGHGLLGSGWRSAWPAYRAELRFMISANIFSYSKMLTRSGDILLFGYFASDSATGIYRLARSLADSLNIFVDAVVQFYNPRLMKLQAEGDSVGFKQISRDFLLYAAMATTIAVPGAWLGLELVNSLILHNNYPGLGLATALLSTNFIWIAGVHPWLWPALVHHSKAQLLARNAMAGALVQALIIAGMCYFIAPRPELAALGALGYYLVCYPHLLMWWRRQ